MRRLSGCNERRWPILVVGLVLIGVGGCSKKETIPTTPRIGPADPNATSSQLSPDEPADPLIASLLDRSVATDERVRRILEHARPATVFPVPALLRVMKDRSQAAFLLINSGGHEDGYRAIEFKESGPDERMMERVAAITALEKIGTTIAIPDLLLALNDRAPVVANHAARALIRLGNRSGLECLLFHLEGKRFPDGEVLSSPAFAGETANTILREITGEDFGFSADAGFKRKLVVAGQWRKRLEAQGERRFALEGAPYQEGSDAETDRRIRFHVAMLGQMQFLYHEQARTMLRRLGVPALSFLRTAVLKAKRNGDETWLAGIAQVLGSIPHANSRQLLTEILDHSGGAAATRALSALAMHGGLEAVSILAKEATKPDPARRLSALESLGEAGRTDQGQRDVVLKALSEVGVRTDPHEEAQRHAALFCASRGSRSADEVLALLENDSVALRNVGHAALVRVLQKTLGYDVVGSKESWKRVVSEYRGLLRALGN